MRICVTTSDRYHHILPVFFYLYGRYWNAPFDLVGYTKPSCQLPDNCTWVSLGEQGPVSEWSTDLRRYFESLPDTHFVWIMEDCLLTKPVDTDWIDKIIAAPMVPYVGKICLTNDIEKREHNRMENIVVASPTSRYRLSMQPSIWYKEYWLQYITPGLDPWTAETQDPKNDGWNVIGLLPPPVVCNEGVTRHNIYKLNLAGMCQEDIDHIKTIAPWAHF